MVTILPYGSICNCLESVLYVITVITEVGKGGDGHNRIRRVVDMRLTASVSTEGTYRGEAPPLAQRYAQASLPYAGFS